MKKIFSLLFFAFICCNVTAQTNDHKNDTSNYNKVIWRKGAQLSLFAGQAGSKNWASGNDIFSVSANVFLNAYANRSRGKWYFNNALTASYGLINTDEYSTIKDDDKIDFFSTVGANTKKVKNLGLGAAFNFRSQFSNGYDRDYLHQGIKRRTSGFFAPAYITIAPFGVNYHKKGIDFYATAIAFKGVFVSNEPYSYHFQGGIIPEGLINEKNPSNQERSVAEMYGVDPKKTVQVQVGPYISLAANKQIFKNVTYAGRLDLFSDFAHNNPQYVDIFWMNTFYLKINKWLHAVYSIDLAYDNDIKKFGYFKNESALQTKSILGLGLSAHFGHKKNKNHKEGVYKKGNTLMHN